MCFLAWLSFNSWICGFLNFNHIWKLWLFLLQIFFSTSSSFFCPLGPQLYICLTPWNYLIVHWSSIIYFSVFFLYFFSMWVISIVVSSSLIFLFLVPKLLNLSSYSKIFISHIIIFTSGSLLFYSFYFFLYYFCFLLNIWTFLFCYFQFLICSFYHICYSWLGVIFSPSSFV